MAASRLPASSLPAEAGHTVNEDRSARYHKLRRLSAVSGVAWSAGLLLALMLTPGSVRLREAAERIVELSGVPTSLVPASVVAVFVLLLGLLHESGSLAIAWYRSYHVEHIYGLSNENLRSWAWDQLKGLLVGAVFSLAGFSLLYAAIRR
ncbi:MAG: hypothetical protein EHM13_13320, partial [Acidobacteria bacterium]